jgi:AcrR family transcriptional regulator
MAKRIAKKKSSKKAAARPKKERKYRGLSPRQRKDERRERLISAGLELFGTKGYHQTTIEQVCSHAKVTTRHFYEEFEGREDLFGAVYDRSVSGVSHAVVGALAKTHEKPIERLRAIIEALVHSMLDDPRQARIQTIEMAALGQSFFPRRDASMKGFAKLIETEADRAAQEGRIEKRDYELTSFAIVAATGELIVQWLIRKEKPDMDKIVNEIVGLLLAMGRG